MKVFKNKSPVLGQEQISTHSKVHSAAQGNQIVQERQKTLAQAW